MIRLYWITTSIIKMSVRVAISKLNLPIRRCLEKTIDAIQSKISSYSKTQWSRKTYGTFRMGPDRVPQSHRFVKNILVSDGANFTRWFRHKTVAIGPLKILTGQYSEKVNVCCEILKEKIINERIIGRNRWTLPCLYLQLDVWSIHNADIVNRNYPIHWIGRVRLGRWPPRSRDLTPLDLFLRAHLQQNVYKSRTSVYENSESFTAITL